MTTKKWPDLRRLGWTLGIRRGADGLPAGIFLERLRASAVALDAAALQVAGFSLPLDHGQAGYRIAAPIRTFAPDDLAKWVPGFDRVRDFAAIRPPIIGEESIADLRYASDAGYPAESDIDLVDSEVRQTAIEMGEEAFVELAAKRVFVVGGAKGIDALATELLAAVPVLSPAEARSVAASAANAIDMGSALHAIDRVGDKAMVPMLRLVPGGTALGNEFANWRDFELVAKRLQRQRLDPTTPEGFEQVRANPDLQLEYQNILDPFFAARYVEIRNALRRQGWDGEDNGTLTKDGCALRPLFKHVGAGRNIAGINYEIDGVPGFFMSDTLVHSPEELAARISLGLPSWLPQRVSEHPNTTVTYTVGTSAGVGEDGTQRQAESESVEIDTAAKDRKKADHIDDVGVKIGGARKDFARRAMTVADLDQMNSHERSELVIMQNIWPFSIKEMRDAGADPGVVAYLRDCRRYIKGLSKRASDEDYRDYVRVLSSLAQHLAGVKTHEDVVKAMRVVGQDVTASDLSSTLGLKASMYLQESFRWTPGQPSVPSGELAYYSHRYSRMNASDEARAAAWAKLLPARRTGLRSSDGPVEPARPHLDSLTFEGPASCDIDVGFRKGKNVPAEALLEVFGFRGVEFGNWLPQDERQRVVNYAYDALTMLSMVLNVPPSFISLDGTLALAFGARGAGRAAAHYEPGRTVVNLTRISGAGALAHEFFHALDDWVARRLGRSDYLTETCARDGRGGYRTDPETAGRNVIEATTNVMGRILTTHLSEEETRLQIGARYEQLVEWAQSWCFYALRGKLVEGGMTMDRAKLEADGILKAMFEETIAQKAASGTFPAGSVANAIFDTLKARYGVKLDKKHRENMEVNLSSASTVLQAKSDIEAGGERKRMAMARAFQKSSYLGSASTLDSRKSKAYWSTPIELAARAFEAFVFDEMKASGFAADYLVHGVEDSRFADKTAYTGNPYPCGEEREAINDAFRTMTAAIKHEFQVGPFSMPTIPTAGVHARPQLSRGFA